MTGPLGALGPYLWVGVGGCLGAAARYALGVWLGARVGTVFPYPTLLINVTGSLALGVLAGLLPLLPERAAPAGRLLLAVGVLGGYTTFSTYALEAVALAQRGEWLRAAGYVAASNGLALVACAAGLAAAGAVARAP